MGNLRAILVVLFLAVLSVGSGASGQSLTETDPLPALTIERARIAEIYRTLPADPYEATAARQSGDAALVTRDWRAAIAEFERAIAIDGGDARTWLRLAEARRLSGDALSSLQAATAARALARIPVEKAAAWALVARSLDRLGERQGALEAFVASLAEHEDANVRRGMTTLQARLKFAVTGQDLQTDAEEAQYCLQFGASLQDRDNVQYGDYIAIEPEIDAIFHADGDRLCIAGFDFGQTYTITVLEGLPAKDERRLGEDAVAEFTVPDRDPVVGFRSSAYVLPRISSNGVPLTSVNVSEATLTLLRINDRNLVQEIRDGYISSQMSLYERDWIVSDKGEQIWTGTIEIESVLNQRVFTAVPVQDMIPEIEPGVYILLAEASGRAIDYWETRATQWLIVSDIGLTTYEGADGLTVLARSLDDAQPMRNLTLTLYARNNEALATIDTDSNGIAQFAPGLLRGEQGMTPTVLMATTAAGDFSYLDITAPAFDLSDRGVGGRAVGGPYDAFLYTDRGVYRPGETVQLVALLRDSRGDALTGLPLSVQLIRPDGSVARTIQAEDDGAGGFYVPLDFSTASPTGRWEAYAFVDPEGAAVGSAGFLVEDVVPAQIEIALSSAATVLTSDSPLTVTVDANYLYGAPGADLPVQAELVIDRDPDPFSEFKNYHFGLADEAVEPVRLSIDGPTTDAEGDASLVVAGAQWPDTANPLRATLYVDVLEPGGRAVGETLSVPVLAHDASIGIRPGFEGDEAPYDAPAEFNVILVDTATRETVSPAGLRYQLIDEQWRYRWYYRYGVWDYQVTVDDVPMGSGVVDDSGDIGLTLDWGHYRLEVFDPAKGIAASYRFSAGWYGRPGDSDTPDTLQVKLDRDEYRPGDRAQAFITAPFEGPVQLILASDRIFRTWTVNAGPDGALAEFTIDAEWGAGAYLLATAFRPVNAAERHGPGRAVGVAWAGIDPALRDLEISMELPARIEPRQRIEVPIEVAGIKSGGSAYLTLAAVDEGILQLTDFADPDPNDYYFGKRNLAIEIRDLYGRLLDGFAGERGVIRSGGDGDLSQRGAPPQIKLVALFSGVVALDENGRTTIPLDIPDYNGRLRLMAVAWDATKVGATSEPLIVRDPVATVISTPRFIAPGDTARLTVALNNLDGPPGDYVLTIAGNDSVGVADPAPQTIVLESGDSAVATVDIEGLEVGNGELIVRLAGPDGWQIERTTMLGVRPAQLPTLDRVAYRLEPGETLTVGSDIAGRFIPGSGEVLVTFGDRPNIDVAGLLRSLDRYPYGCLEQTTSRALPLLYVAEVARLWGQEENEAELRGRIDGAITRILDMQRWDGSFSTWSSYGYVDNWLSAFAMDFLTRARSFGYDVPDFAYQNGLSWLTERVGMFDDRSSYGLADRSYAAYVLASAGVGDAAPLRYMFDTLDRDVSGHPMYASPLTLAHLGAGLALFGELDRAQTAFADAIALDWDKSVRYYDYGSSVRDLALTVALASETGIASFDTVGVVERLVALYAKRPYLSTQEEGALLLAAASIGGDGEYSLAIDGATPATYDAALAVYREGDELAQDIVYENAGTAPVWANVTVIGSPVETLPASDEGLAIARQYFDLAGNEIDPSEMRQGDIALVRLDVNVNDDTGGQILVVDLLPAGLEAENPHLADSRNAEAFGWLPELAVVDHDEYRDDRYVAAVTWEGRGSFKLAYLVRAVTPGTYVMPAPVAEVMYDPSIRGRGEAGQMTVTSVR
jgi:uncharacterized protein YfaS (alpha-2-macroglobulin family)